MTTKVTVEVPFSANYKCNVFQCKLEDDSSISLETFQSTVMPGESAVFHVYGEESLFIREELISD